METKTDTLTKPEVVTEYGEPGDHERLAHYYDKRVYDLMESAVNGTPIKALCGKLWVPNRDPEKFPICPECQATVDYRSKD